MHLTPEQVCRLRDDAARSIIGGDLFKLADDWLELYDRLFGEFHRSGSLSDKVSEAMEPKAEQTK